MAFRTLTWNTGRLYTREGQVITARYDIDTGCVIFHDHSRQIAGELRNGLPFYVHDGHFAPTDTELRDFVDREYLHNRYDHSDEAYRLPRNA